MPFSTTLTVNWEVLEAAAASGSNLVNWEVIEGTPFSDSLLFNWEAFEGTPFSGSVLINWEVLTPTAAGGDPDSILNLPAHAVASRLRADFYGWNVEFTGHNYTAEHIGSKVGSGSLLSISDFSYSYNLDAAGDWEMTIPANDPHASYIISGEAKVLKLYYEGVGLIFIGMIEDYSFSDAETMTITGYDFMGVLTRKNSLWRINLENFYHNNTVVTWIQNYTKILGNARFPYRFEVMPALPAWIGTANDFVGVQPKYQSQSIVEILSDLYNVSGVHFRIQPNMEMITLGIFGEDSGITISPVQEDDPLVREQGALVLKSIEYINSKEELFNMIVPQGSNDSFGVAVELKHGNYVYGIHVPWRPPASGESGFPRLQSATSSQEDPNSAFTASWQNLTVKKRDSWPLDLIPMSLLEAIWEDYLNPPSDQDAGNQFSTYYEGVANTNVIEVGRMVAAAAVRIEPDRDFYPTIVSFMNIGGIGSYNISIVPDDGGLPDTSNLSAGLLRQKNYPRGAPGQKVRRPSSSQESNPSQIHIAPRGVSAQIDENDIEFGTINELMAFMEQPPYSFPPWPLLEDGNDYWVVIWNNGFSQFPGFDSSPGVPANVAFGDSHVLRLLRNTNGAVSNALCAYFNGVTWTPTTDIVCSVYGWSPEDDHPYAVEGATAPSVDDNGTGHRIFFMRDFESIEEHGLREASVSFESAIDASDGIDGVVPAANSIFLQATQYLQNHSQPFERITLTATGAFRLPYVGQKVRVVYRGMAQVENGKYKWVDINDDYFVLNIGWNISNEEISHTFTFASTPEDIIDPDRNLRKMASSISRARHYFGEIQTAGRRVGDGA